MIGVGVFFIFGSVAFFFVWKNSSKFFVEQYQILPDGSVEVIRIPKDVYERTKQQEQELKRQTEQDEQLKQQDLAQKEALKEAEHARVFRDAWGAEVRGYYEVSTRECPPWEQCQTARVASIVITETQSIELSQYLARDNGEPLSFDMGCEEGRVIRYIPQQFLFKSPLPYQKFSGNDFEALKKSSKEHPVMLRVTKPYDESYPYGTEGLICMTPFSSFEVVGE